ncbi:hypothetical protein A3Q56_07889 [Intoshia linei]|uniref:Uncharacterized protein n=1 Tax=Intoshia linei TaxID=1819745 RepID=A0A177AQU4_9BILA|nr:hypothetical protein A3Q56_07889 [Intoshia linei]
MIKKLENNLKKTKHNYNNLKIENRILGHKNQDFESKLNLQKCLDKERIRKFEINLKYDQKKKNPSKKEETVMKKEDMGTILFIEHCFNCLCKYFIMLIMPTIYSESF